MTGTTYPRFLFVYGTLQPHLAPPHLELLLRTARDLGEATVWGVLYDLGSYPGAVLGQTGQPVLGRLLELPALPAVWAALDQYEGPGFRRVTTSASIGGREVLCGAYVLPHAPAGRPLIATGRWTPPGGANAEG